MNYFEKIAHSDNKQTQLIAHNILNKTSKNSLWLWQHPNLDQYNTKQKNKTVQYKKIINNE